MNRIAAALLLVSLGFGVAGLYATSTKGKPGGMLVVDPRSCDFGTLALKERASVYVVFRNESDSTVRLLGASGFCAKQGCLSATGLPMDIPAGEEARVDVRVVGKQPGPFALELPFYTGIEPRSAIRVRISGVIEGTLTAPSAPRS